MFSSLDKILYAISFVGCLFLLINSRLNLRNRQQRTLFIAAVFGFLCLGLAVYGRMHLATLRQLSMARPYYIIKGLMVGVFIALLIPIVWQHGYKTLLWVWALLFIAFNVFVFTSHHFRNEYAFYSFNASLLGTMTTLAILHFRQRMRIEGI